MRVELEDFKTGWFKVEVYLKTKDVDHLIRLLTSLRTQEVGQHFPVTNSAMEGSGGVFSVEFIKDDETSRDTFQALGLAISPNR